MQAFSLPPSVSAFPFPLTQQQRQALNAIWEFLQPTAPTSLFLLAGYAGTGKSTVILQLVKTLVHQGKRVVLTAPTNKAVSVLQRLAIEHDVTGVDFCTIHQLLGLGMISSENEKILAPTGTSYIELFDVVLIDECSMIGIQLWHWIEEAVNRIATRFPLKVILMGDPAQLNPVNEGRSPAFKVSNKAILTQVVRQGTDSPLLEFITACRYAVTQSKAPFEPFARYLSDKSNGALLVKRRSLLKYAFKKISSEFAENPDCFRILCWTNAQVDFYNQQIRNHLYGSAAPGLIVGERLITRDPVLAPDRKTIVLPTSTEFTIQERCEDRYSNYKAWRLKVTPEDGNTRQIYVLHEDEQSRFDVETQRLKAIANRNPFLWRDYYRHLEQFAQIRNCFAITVHNSQGSTFLECGVDGQDLSKRLTPEQGDTVKMRLAKVREHNRLWYVGASRARRRIFVVP